MPQAMCHAVGLQGLKALEIKQRLNIAMAGGIAFECGNNVSPRRKADFRLFFHGIFKGLHHQFGAQIHTSQALGQTVHQGPFKGIVIENGGENETAKNRLLAGNVFRFPPHAVPDGINRLHDLRLGGLAHGSFSSTPYIAYSGIDGECPG